MPLDVLGMKLTKKGFDLTFTKPLDPELAGKQTTYKLKRYYYEYHQAYGSKQYDLADVLVSGVTISPDRKSVSLELPELKAWRVYELRLDGLKAADGTSIANPLICYTLNHLHENTPPRPPPGVSTKAIEAAD